MYQKIHILKLFKIPLNLENISIGVRNVIFLIVRINIQCNSSLLWNIEKSFLTMSKARILVVDDEPAVLKVLVTRLQLAGYQVYSATNGEEALESFHRDSPDLIVLDVMLPKMDGFAVCRRIRAESVVPIIFLTALEAISERVAGLDLGADDYLSKPCLLYTSPSPRD